MERPLSPAQRLRRLIRLPGHPRVIRQDVDAEIAFHLQATEREMQARGLAPDDARREALRRFGDIDQVRQSLGDLDRRGERRRRVGDFWRGWGRDLARSLRTLRREPGFASVVVITLALGLGANATMFRVVDRVLLQPAPHVRNDGSLSLLYFQRETPEFGRVTNVSRSYPMFEYMRARFAPSGDLAAWWVTSLSSGRGAEARKLEVNLVTPNFLGLVGVQPWAGRLFDAGEWKQAGEPGAVLTYAFAASLYGDPRAALGKHLSIGNTTHTVIGVTPPGFVGANLRPVDAFVTMQTGAAEVLGKDWYSNKNMHWLQVVARKNPGVDIRQVAAVTTAALRDAGRALGKGDSTTTVIAGSIISARRPNGAPATRIALWLSGVSLLVLVVACANVANLILARTIRRRRELAVHLALGVSRARVTRALFTETLVLGAAAGAVALLLARWGEAMLRSTLLAGLPWDAALLDPRAAGFLAGMVVLACGLAGAVPAVVASRTPLMEALKAGVREGGGRRKALRLALVVVQGTLSVILLVGAGLFVRSFQRASSLDLGFVAEGLLVASPDVSQVAKTPEHHEQLWNQFEARVRELPGVLGVTQSVTVPFESQWERTILVNGDTVPPLKGGGPYVNAVSPGYFAVMGTPVVRGRPFTETDRKGGANVAVVNESMARQLWPGREVVGQCFGVEETPGCVTVVGVVPDGRMTAIGDAPPPQFFQPLGQWTPGMRSLFIRTALSGDALLPVIRRSLLEVEGSLPYVEIREMSSVVDEQLSPWRLGAAMFGLFGVLGLVVAALGLYSVIAHDVTQRTHEIGVRMALGARRGHVGRLVVTGGLRQALLGITLGVAISWVVSLRMADVLFETSPRDPWIYVGVVLLLLLVAVIAALSPARRATRVQPIEVLRGD